MVTQEEYDVKLNLEIHYADGIDTQTKDPKGDKRVYIVLGCVNYVKKFHTPKVEGLPNPVWNSLFHIPLGRLMPGGFGFLNVEVVRIGSKSDPGTSTGIALVGRTQIPLPKDMNQKKEGRFGLMMPKGAGYTAEGHILISMEIKRMDA